MSQLVERARQLTKFIINHRIEILFLEKLREREKCFRVSIAPTRGQLRRRRRAQYLSQF
jgi:hypothetical protein